MIGKDSKLISTHEIFTLDHLLENEVLVLKSECLVTLEVVLHPLYKPQEGCLVDVDPLISVHRVDFGLYDDQSYVSLDLFLVYLLEVVEGVSPCTVSSPKRNDLLSRKGGGLLFEEYLYNLEVMCVLRCNGINDLLVHVKL